MSNRKQDWQNLYDLLSEGYNQEFLNSILKPTGRSSSYATRDYIAASAVLAELNKVISFEKKSELRSRSDIKAYLHPNILFRLNMYTPCLAYRFDELKPEAQRNLFENPSWLFTEKQNGVRGIIVHHKGKTCLFSRNYSVTGELPEYWGNVLQEISYDGTFALDVEIKYEPKCALTEVLSDYGIRTDSKLEAISSLLQMNQAQALEIQREYKSRFNQDLLVFRLITTLYYNGVDYRKRLIGDAYSIETEVINNISNVGLNLKPIRKITGSKEEKEIFLNQIIDVEHGEGVVAHNLNGYYCTSENRDKNVFVKIKRSVGQQASKQGMGDTIDCFVTGYKLGNVGTANENLVSALEFTTYLAEDDGSLTPHVIAYAPNLELELKRRITVIKDGKLVLHPDVYNLVGCLQGQSISYQSHRLTHPRLIEFPRTDKSPSDCIISRRWMESQIDFQPDTEFNNEV